MLCFSAVTISCAVGIRFAVRLLARKTIVSAAPLCFDSQQHDCSLVPSSLVIKTVAILCVEAILFAIMRIAKFSSLSKFSLITALKPDHAR